MRAAHRLGPYLLLISIGLFTGCSKEEAPSTTETNTTELANMQDLAEARQIMWASFNSPLSKFSSRAKALQLSTATLLASPTSENLSAAQLAWYDCDRSLQPLSLLRHLAHTQADIFRELSALEYRLAASPIQPGYLDRFGVYAYSGIVFDIGMPLTSNSLSEQHGATDEEEVVLGLYAIEFMLFGENGSRSVKDYLEVKRLSEANKSQGLESIEEVPENRRRKLLELQVELFISDIHHLGLLIQGGHTDSAHARWSELDPQQQISSARNAANAALTQILVDIGHLQTKITAKQSRELPDNTLVSNTPFRRLAEASASQLQAIQALVPYYSEIEQGSMQAALNKSIEQLKTLPLDPKPESEEAETISENLQSVYETLKPLI